jgi:hypothetical protein
MLRRTATQTSPRSRTNPPVALLPVLPSVKTDFVEIIPAADPSDEPRHDADVPHPADGDRASGIRSAGQGAEDR